MEAPRLRVEAELQLPACATATVTWNPSHVCNLHHSPLQSWILNPLSEARDWPHILMETSRIHHCWAAMGTFTTCSWDSGQRPSLERSLPRPTVILLGLNYVFRNPFFFFYCKNLFLFLGITFFWEVDNKSVSWIQFMDFFFPFLKKLIN